MATNPFDDADGRFVVLVNDEGQHSLWPARIRRPEGWQQMREEGSKQECTEYIEANWTDLRPRSVVAAMGG
ncbi:MbtH family protein [Streptomyces sp. NPDC059688]|jgi:MbtH protein|uniref:MbtH family protein n=2 Tax=Streptomyces TaxID=1883 RepID=A0ABV1TYC0_9ACTN|nr:MULTISPECIES: MbtH family protein [unclassified Streptomyces]OKJ81780.1 protein mbtH [Streptomyces sp. CB01883]PKW06087.1 MbtH protein [Streptomyces sp. 5112.2]ROP54922.1 MbtH protein [Streptomyces sp. PanSC9]UXY34247.1 MbtH family protein [Streptomyces sp. HUAS 14-6]SEC40493.1 MbtH protein [Streptomyces sp. 2231.1]